MTFRILRPLTFVFILGFALNSMATDKPLIPTRFLKVEGSKVAVYESAGKKGPGILLIHGNTSSANSYAKVMRSTFAKNQRVVALDLPGFGRSEKRERYDIASFTRVIATVANATKVNKGVIVGWSLGGDLALQASGSLPDAKGFFLFGTAPLGGAPTSAPYPFLAPQESYAGEAVLYGTTPELSKSQVYKYVRAFFAPGKNVPPPILIYDGIKTDPNTRLAVALAVTGNDPSFLPEVWVAQNLKVPVALVYTTQDAFLKLDYLKAIEKTIPSLWRQKTVVLKNKGHILQWEDPQLFIRTLQSFIREI